MFSMCSELTPRARIPDTRIPQLMQPCLGTMRLNYILQDRFMDTPLHIWVHILALQIWSHGVSLKRFVLFSTCHFPIFGAEKCIFETMETID